MQANIIAARSVLVMGATFETDNMGVGALASGAISILSARYPDAQISFLDYGRLPNVSTIDVDGTLLQVPLLNLRFSWKVFLQNNIVYLLVVSALSRMLGQRFTQRAIRRNRWLKAIREADVALAVSGGDSFSDIYGLGRFFYVFLPQLLVVSVGTRLVLLPQTIGPFRTRLARHLAQRLLGRAERVYSRDRAGVRDLQGMPGGAGDTVRFCYDMGFILRPRLPRQGRLDELASLKRTGCLLVGFNVSGLLLMRGYDGRDAFELKTDYRELVERTIEFLVRVKDANVVLVPHVFGAAPESDAVAAAKLFESLKDRYPARLVCIRGSFDQHEIKYVVGQCDLFIGARMHACIAALSQAIPAVGMAYSSKFLGVFETVGAQSLVADLRTSGIDDILGVIDDTVERRAEIREALRRTMVDVKRDLLASLDGIA
jgi:polysaccharide pyruvyl transferase WcaK-like protein